MALVLFTDASRVNIHELRRDIGLPVRLLAIGLPLTIGFGTAAAFGIIPGISLWVAATRVPSWPHRCRPRGTIMGDTRIPNRIRRLLNVESGLNDGIATPFVNLFLAGAVTTEVVHSTLGARRRGGLADRGRHRCRRRSGRGLGAGLGQRRGWSAPGFRTLAALGLALLAYCAALEATATGSSLPSSPGWPSAAWYGPTSRPMVGFAEEAGGLLSLMVWLIFGAAMAVPGFDHANWSGLCLRRPGADRGADGLRWPSP